MPKQKRMPVGIVATVLNAELVRQAVRGLDVTYRELPVPGRDDLVRFAFDPMSAADSQKLAAAIPKVANYFQATFVQHREGR
jgi:hypothetical protein